MRPARVRRSLLILVAVVLTACAVLWTYSHVVVPRLILRVAVGGDQGETQKFMTALAPLLGGERWRMRFRQINFEDPAAAAGALDRGEIDLMIARSDVAPRTGQTIAIVRHDAIALVLPPDTTIEKFADIARKAIAIPAGPMQKQNEALLDQLLDYYAIPRNSVTRVVMPAADMGQAIRQKRAVAVFAIGPASLNGPVAESIASIRKVMRKPPTILELGEASALAKKLPQLETLEIPRGAFSGNPAVPDDTANTLSVTVRLLARAAMSNTLAGDLARIVTTRKQVLADATQGLSQIEAPDTEDKNALLPLHPGANTYYSGETLSLFDRFENFIYYGGLFASIIGSLIAWSIGRWRSGRQEKGETGERLSAMLEAIREMPGAEAAKRRELMRTLDLHADWALGELVAGRMERASYETVEALVRRGQAYVRAAV